MTARVFALLLSMLTPVAFAQGQSQTYSSSAGYKSMLEELHQDPVLPSRMSAGTPFPAAQAPADLKVHETHESLRVESSTWHLEVAKAPWDLALTNKETGLTWRLAGESGSAGVLWTESNSGGMKLGRTERIERQGDRWRMRVAIEGSATPATVEIAVLSPSVIQLSVRAPKMAPDARTTLGIAGEGPFFGLGERFDRIKLDGLKTVLRPEDLLGKPGHNWTYIPVPFLFTPRGLGMYLDTAAVSTFDLSQPNKFSAQVNNPSIDAYFFIGMPKEILRNYTSLTGRTPLPPPWTFGVWICSYQGPQAVLEDARRLRKEKIPSSAIWTFDVMDQGDIMGWPLWWTGYYPHPRQFTDQLHGMGFKVLTYVHPYLRSVLAPYKLPNPTFEEGLKTGLVVLDAKGKPSGPTFEPFLDGNVDFTSAKNVDWWEKKVRKIVIDDNFDGWMEDYGEYVNDTDRFAAGVTGHKMTNLYPLMYHRIAYEIAKKAKPDIVEFVRSGYAGSQGYTRVVWGGDQFPNWTQDYGLPSVVRAGITAGLSGFGVWGPDIAGNGRSKELWTRWVEFGALTPVMRNHLWDKPYGAVNLWYDAQTTDTFRRYAGLHVSLFPYFYTFAQEAAKTGLPIMRHPLLEFPADPKTWDSTAEYMLGDKILVAPVVEQGATSRTLYLPRGSWADYWSGKVIEGGRQVTVPAPLEQIPIFVRAGSVLPFLSPETETLAADLAGSKYTTAGNDLTWRVFPSSKPGQSSSFTLYDGTVAEVTQNASRIDLRIQQSPVARNYEVVFPANVQPRQIVVNGKRLDQETSTSKVGWQFDPKDKALHVRVKADNFDLTVQR